MAIGNGEPSFLETVRNVVVTYKGTVGDPVSLADISKIARVEPITLISSNLSGTPELYNVLHGVLNIYAAYYLQAVQILSAQLSDVRILKILDQTNPDRDLKTLLTSGYTAYESYADIRTRVATMSLEDAKFKLPMVKTDWKNLAMESQNLFPDAPNYQVNLSPEVQTAQAFNGPNAWQTFVDTLNSADEGAAQPVVAATPASSGFALTDLLNLAYQQESPNMEAFQAMKGWGMI